MTDTVPEWIASWPACFGDGFTHPKVSTPPALDDGIAAYNAAHPDAYRTGPGEPAGFALASRVKRDAVGLQAVGEFASDRDRCWPASRRWLCRGRPQGAGRGSEGEAMSAGPVATQIILVPIGASVDYGRAQKPPRYPQKLRTGTWRPATGIPDRSAHREAVRQLLERTREQRREMLETAKAMPAAA